MINFLKTATLMTVAAAAAFANGGTIQQMSTEAQKLAAEAKHVSALLKGKNVDAAAVHQALEVKESGIGRLRDLAATFEGSQPSLGPAQQKQWEMVKNKIQLLEVFHANKKRLVEGDLKKNRSLVRAHAQGLAVRAEMLEKALAGFHP